MNTTRLNVNDAIGTWLKTYGGDNISVVDILCDRYVSYPERVGLYYESASGENLKMTFAELSRCSAKMAGFLQSLGIEKGDRVAVMLPRIPELIISALAIWRVGAVYVPLFTAFGPKAIQDRIDNCLASVIITNAENRDKITPPDQKSKRYCIITVADHDGRGIQKDDYSYWRELEEADPLKAPVRISGDDLIVLLYTSGTTGSPMGCEIPAKCLAAFEAYMRFGLDVRKEDVFWNMADPGWGYGIYYNLIGSLLIGKAILFYNGHFDPVEVYNVIKKYRVSNLTGAPTAFKVMMNAGDELGRSVRNYLRVASSAGEPLSIQVINWAKKVWGIPIYDHYGQTEGGMMINNHHMPGLEEKIIPGSMGKPMPGYCIVLIDENGLKISGAGEGELAVDLDNSPLFCFRRYWNNSKETEKKIGKDSRYYLTGDLVRVDREGFFYFIGRADDVILSAGYRIGPVEIENVLQQHKAVKQAAVVGCPDELRGELIKAYIVLNEGYGKDDLLVQDIKQFVKRRLSAHVYPKQIEFVNSIPTTINGKTKRHVLKKQNLLHVQ